VISPDAPITTASEDRLGRSDFAAALTEAIATVSGRDSFVIGIHGKWGTGKSSVLNLIAETIDRRNKAAAEGGILYVLRFNPWNFSD
jgi:predicted KAP-like P-loop ATPase